MKRRTTICSTCLVDESGDSGGQAVLLLLLPHGCQGGHKFDGSRRPRAAPEALLPLQTDDEPERERQRTTPRSTSSRRPRSTTTTEDY